LATPEVGAVVVGAGVAGLAAGLALQGVVREVLVVDASDRPGGVMRTDHVGGYVGERGPNTFQLKAPMWDSLRELGIGDALRCAEPASRLRLIYHGGALEPVPMSPVAFARSRLLSRRGKLRLLGEPFVRRGDAAGESVAEVVRRRLGDEGVANLVGPFLTGVYAGDEEELGAEAVFGTLAELERGHRSIALGGLARALRRRGPRVPGGTWSTSHGLGPFARQLAGRLAEPPVLRARAVELHRDGERWVLEVSSATGESSLASRRMVLAVPAWAGAELLHGVDAELAGLLAGIDYAPIVGVPIGVDPADVATPIEGFGFLVPRDAGISLLGCLFMSRLFPDRAPAGRELLQCMVGGRRWPDAVSEPDDDLLARVESELDRTLGLRGEPVSLGPTRWARAVPQPGRDHVQRVAELRRGAAELGGLALAGAYLDGVGVPDAYASGLRAAADLS
jgi:oxygen-dependent protoporphyrinogen oxidase